MCELFRGDASTQLSWAVSLQIRWKMCHYREKYSLVLCCDISMCSVAESLFNLVLAKLKELLIISEIKYFCICQYTKMFRCMQMKIDERKRVLFIQKLKAPIWKLVVDTDIVTKSIQQQCTHQIVYDLITKDLRTFCMLYIKKAPAFCSNQMKLWTYRNAKTEKIIQTLRKMWLYVFIAPNILRHVFMRWIKRRGRRERATHTHTLRDKLLIQKFTWFRTVYGTERNLSIDSMGKKETKKEEEEYRIWMWATEVLTTQASNTTMENKGKQWTKHVLTKRQRKNIIPSGKLHLAHVLFFIQSEKEKKRN